MKEAPSAAKEGELMPKIPFRFSAINKGDETYLMLVGSPEQISETVRALGNEHGVPVLRAVITYKNKIK